MPKELIALIILVGIMVVVVMCGCANDTQIGQQPSIGGVNSGGQAIVTQATGNGWLLLMGFVVFTGMIYIIARNFKKVSFNASRKLKKQT